MSLAIAPVIDTPAWVPTFVPTPEPPAPLKLKRSKSGKIRQDKVCPGCKAKVSHVTGCAAYATSLDRLTAWQRYGTWQRATLGDDAYFRTDLSGFNLTMLPYPGRPACTSCGQEEWEHREQHTGYGNYGSTRVTRPAADHAFIAGTSNTPGLHPLSTWSIQFAPEWEVSPQLKLSDALLTELRSAAPQPAVEITEETAEDVS